MSAPIVMADLETIKAAFREMYREERAREQAASGNGHDPSEPVTTKEAASLAELCASSVEKKLRSGEVPGKKNGRWSTCRGWWCPCPTCVVWQKAGAR